MKTVKKFDLYFEDAEGYGEDSLEVTVTAESWGNEINIDLEFSRVGHRQEEMVISEDRYLSANDLLPEFTIEELTEELKRRGFTIIEEE
ncbi:MAG: hypothetical protein NTX72_04785 [Candidatus Uhrbacteria bacterium]|nr:hypothetical protein [Candidatus Uhrbacteria bacterium]